MRSTRTWVLGVSLRASAYLAGAGTTLGALGGLAATGCGGSPPPAAASAKVEGAGSAPAPGSGSGSGSAPAPAPGSAPGSAPASGSASAPGSAPAAASAPAPASAPIPTGGSVLVGDIPASKKFDPKPVIEAGKQPLLDCYNQARAKVPDLAGKLKLRVVVNQSGAAVAVEAEPGGAANDPSLVACLREALKGLTFPKPGGMATVVVPLAFRP